MATVPMDKRLDTLLVDNQAHDLTLRVWGYQGLLPQQIAFLRQKLTEFFYRLPGEYNGSITVTADISGHLGQQARRIQLLIYQLRMQISPALQFELSFSFPL